MAFVYSDVTRLRDVRLAITFSGSAWSVTVNANTPPDFEAGIKGGAFTYSAVTKLASESLLIGDADIVSAGGNWFLDLGIDLAPTLASGTHSVVQYSDITVLRDEPLETATSYTGSAFSVTVNANAVPDFETGQYADWAADPWSSDVAITVAPDFAAGTWTERTYSAEAFVTDQNAPETGTVLVMLLTLTHPDWDDPVRLSTDPTVRISDTTTDVLYGTMSGDTPYYYLPLQVTLPSQTEEGPLKMRLTLDNVSRDLIAQIRTLSSPPVVDVDLVSTTKPELVLASWPQFLLVNVNYDALTISGELVLETLVHEPFPAGTFTPSEFSGLF